MGRDGWSGLSVGKPGCDHGPNQHGSPALPSKRGSARPHLRRRHPRRCRAGRGPHAGINERFAIDPPGPGRAVRSDRPLLVGEQRHAGPAICGPLTARIRGSSLPSPRSGTNRAMTAIGSPDAGLGSNDRNGGRHAGRVTFPTGQPDATVPRTAPGWQPQPCSARRSTLFSASSALGVSVQLGFNVLPGRGRSDCLRQR
jgi:hypothetical protein